jgi:hypothetical protein
MDLLISSQLIQSFNTSGEHTYQWNTSTDYNAVRSITVVGYDSDGNSANVSITVTVDNTLPTAIILSPANNTYLKGMAEINFTFGDANLDKATLSLGGQVVNVTGSNYYPWDTTTAVDGKYVLVLTVSDKAGNIQTDEITVTVDNTVSDGKIYSPTNSTYVKGSVDIAFYGYDANLVSMSLRVDEDSVLQTWNISGTHDYSWDTTTATDGLHSITLTIYDESGNQLTTSIQVNVDNTSPTVSIVSPQDGATVSGTVTINYTANDASTFSLVLFVDNAQIIIYPHQAYQWDTTKVVDGNHTVSIIATDIAGNTKTQTITVKTVNAAPAYMTYIGYASAGILGLILGALAVWTFLKRRPSSKPAA